MGPKQKPEDIFQKKLETDQKKEKVIDVVEQHPDLYDKLHPLHHDRIAKCNSWIKIASEIKMEGKRCILLRTLYKNTNCVYLNVSI